MAFAWNETKNRINRRKHGISFEAAVRVFDDPSVVSYQDRVVDDEVRWHSIGCVSGITILLVVHTVRKQMAKKKSASSQQEKRLPASALFTTPISDKHRRELERLAKLPDAEIDLSDAPERNPQRNDVRVGMFYRPVKQLVSLRVDADVLAWFRDRGKKYQTHMNEVLRREMLKGKAS